MNNTSRVTEPYWAERFEDAETDEDVMALAWSYLLSRIRNSATNAPQRNQVRRDATAAILAIATQDLLQ